MSEAQTDSAALTSPPALSLPAIQGNAKNVSRQLRIEQKLFGYQYGRTETETQFLTDQLAAWIASNGVSDIRDIELQTHFFPVVNAETGVSDNIGAHVLANKYGGALFLIGENVAVDCPGEAGQSGCYDFRYRIFDGQFIVGLADRYSVVFTPGALDSGLVYFIPELHRANSLWQDLRVLIGAAMMMIPGVNAVIGEAIFGSLMASYPIAASIATDAIVNTALSGGNIEQGVKSALTGAAGGAFGGAIGGAFDSELIARISGAGANAVLSGTDVNAAVKSALIGYGAGSAGDFVSGMVQSPATDQLTVPPNAAQGNSGMNDFSNPFSSADFSPADPLTQFASLDLNIGGDMFGSISNPLQASAYDNLDLTNYADASQLPVIDPSSGTPFQIDPAVQNPQAFFSDARYEAASAAPASTMADGSGYASGDEQPTSAVVQMSDATAHFSDARDSGIDYSGGPASAPVPGNVLPANTPYTFAQGVKDATAVVISAIAISDAYIKAHRPASVPAGAKVSAAGGTVTAQADGNVAVRTPDGRVTVQRPPVGVPYVMADGGAIVNNGDGTYTYAAATGATVTRPYATPAKAMSGKTLAIGAGVVGALLLLSR